MLTVIGLTALAHADTAIDDRFVESGREALRTGIEFPWYDADEDALQRVEVEPIQDDLQRHSDWASETSGKQNSKTDSVRELVWQIMQMLMWLFLGGLLVLLVWAPVWAAMRTLSADTNDSRMIEDIAVGADRIEKLPVNIPRTRKDLLTAARSFRDAGDHDQAIVYAFAYQLVELDRHQLIQLSKGKTNRQYLWELRRCPEIRELIRPTMLAFEDVFFGHHQLSLARFQKCWAMVNDFSRQLEQASS